jgi:hypothetical protein
MSSAPTSSEAVFSRRRFLGPAFAGTAATLASPIVILMMPGATVRLPPPPPDEVPVKYLATR